MASDAQIFPQQLLELLHYLSMELQIPLLSSQINQSGINAFLEFGYQCLNKIMINLATNWKFIHFLKPQSNSLEIDVGQWRNFISIVEECFLDEDSKQIGDPDDVTIQDLIETFGILCHGCEAIRQSSEQLQLPPKSQKEKQQNKQKQKKQPKKPKKQPSPQNNNKKRDKKHKQPILGNELEKEIIETVAKTLKNRKKVENPKFTAKHRDKQANGEVEKAKRVFDYTVKNAQKQNWKRKNNNVQTKKTKFQNQGIKVDVVDKSYLKYIENKHKKLNDEVESQQLRYYLELRDKKIAYIRHIHQLIQKLERERQIDLGKQQREQHNQKKKEMQLKIEQVNNIFSSNIQQLTQNFENKRKQQAIQHVEQINVCREIEKSVKEKKKKQLDEMRNIWEAQTQKLQLITGDQEKMKKKLIEIYRKNRV